jgi:UDP-N-acetylmuramoyl-tripeptide--D-alanyl-D-alanine ligase
MAAEPRFTHAEVVAATGARPTSTPRAPFDGVSTDSRTLVPGQLFVALRGERFDGHEFVAVAKQHGAAAAMVAADAAPAAEQAGLPLLVVDDTRLALGRLSYHWRRRFSIPLVAVTGSNGKTTVKEMIASVLRAQHGDEHTLATEGNLNNDIGVPLTLLRLRATHRSAVVELGMNHPGETAYLAALAAPTVALVNNAQREHQEFMKSVADVAHEHGAAFAEIAAGGVAVINADDEFAGYWRSLVVGRPAAKGRVSIVDFGIDRSAQVTGRYAFTGFGSEITLRTPAGGATVRLQVPGRHNVLNAVAATSAAIASGAGLDAVTRGLESFRAVKGRMQRKTGRGGAVVIDDTYNANPDSVRAAIDVLAAQPGGRILVLGDMGEVGEQGEAFHREIGGYAKASGIQRLLATGALCRRAVEAFGAGAAHFEDFDGLLAAALGELGPDAVVLVKGSRFMRMERVVAALVEETACC